MILRPTSARRLTWLLLISGAACGPVDPGGPEVGDASVDPPRATVFRDVRVFDGEATIPVATVVLLGDRIEQVALPSETVDAPDDADVVNGVGKTLLPGLIDAHTHSFTRAALKGGVAFGVTTNLDMFTALPLMHEMRAEQEAGDAADRADLFSAGTLVTAPGGHGTQYGVPIPTLSIPEEAQDFIDARLEEGSDYIKIIFEDGSAFGMTTPTLNAPTLEAAIDAAQTRGKMTVVHIGSYAGARTALEMSPDGLVHIFADQPPGTEFAELVAASGAFIVPTLTVVEATTGAAGGIRLVEDPFIGPRLFPADVQNLGLSFPTREGTTLTMGHAFEAVRLAHQAGASILAGTDAPNPGTALGASMHRELELLVLAGLTPTQALAAATSVTAEAFGLNDRGRIVVGRRADVVLVDGNPTEDILATRAIEGIWKEGRRWKLELYIEQAEGLRVEAGR